MKFKNKRATVYLDPLEHGLMTPKQAAKFHRVGLQTVHYWIKCGMLPVLSICGTKPSRRSAYFLRVEDVKNYVRPGYTYGDARRVPTPLAVWWERHGRPSDPANICMETLAGQMVIGEKPVEVTLPFIAEYDEATDKIVYRPVVVGVIEPA